MKAENFFDNPLTSKEITPSRLCNFADDSVAKLTEDNPNGIFTNLIADITKCSTDVQAELGEVQSTLAQQKGKTLTVNKFIIDFKTYMSDNEGVIAKAIGGKKSASFLDFYPQGLTQYNNVSKTKIEAILKQVSDAAEKHKAKLDKTIYTELKGFAIDYVKIRKDQLGQKGKVSDNRADRTNNVKKLEIALLKALHKVGETYADDIKKCCSYFNFSLLYPKGRVSKTLNKQEEKKA